MHQSSAGILFGATFGGFDILLVPETTEEAKWIDKLRSRRGEGGGGIEEVGSIAP